MQEATEAQFLKLRDQIMPLATVLLARCHDLYTSEKRHPLERPGLRIDCHALDGKKHIIVRIHPGEHHEVVLKDPDGFVLERFVRMDEVVHVNLGLQLSKTFDEQNSFIRGFHLAQFNHCATYLRQAVKSIDRNTPMDAAASWDDTLIEFLPAYANNRFNHDQYTRWVLQWGTPEMQNAFLIANGFCDWERDFDAWKSIFSQSLLRIKGPQDFHPNLSFDCDTEE